MAQYIPKFILVEEIENIKENAKKRGEIGKISTIVVCDELLNRLNTIEAKEIDLDKIFNDEYSKFSNDTDAMDYAFPIDLADFKDFAKHFFVLGLRAAQKGEEL